MNTRKDTKNATLGPDERIIVLVSEAESSARHRRELESVGYRATEDTSVFTYDDNDGHSVAVEIYEEIVTFLSVVKHRPVSAVIIDNRATAAPASFSDTTAGRVLPNLLSLENDARNLPKSAIFVILPDFSATAQHAFVLGSLQLGGVVVAPKSFTTSVDSIWRTVRKPETGKVALCLAGGGIEGLFYELGVLRALDDALGGRSVTEFDIFSGISAGAVISACVANGVRPLELANALKGRPSRIDPITRGMLFDPNFGEIAGRLIRSAGDVLRGEWLRTPLDAALRVTPNALFSGDRLRWHLEKEFSKPGMTNDFNRLDKELYVGVTDQDTGSHVTFGEQGTKDIPISHAVRASCAMTPYYSPEQIGGRFYIDGIFTRTINLDVTVAHGAKLVICVDPLTPIRSENPGYVSWRGGFFNTVQSIKSMIRTRFSEVIDRAEEAYPNVSVVVFSPTAKDLEKMSGTMMRFFYKIETEEMAYASAIEQIQRDYAWLTSDFRRHGFELKQ